MLGAPGLLEVHCKLGITCNPISEYLREARFDFVASEAKSILLLSFISHSLI